MKKSFAFVTSFVMLLTMSLTLTTALITLDPAIAHEGHNMAPQGLSAPHGGQLKGTSQLYLELVADTSGFTLYTVDHTLQSIPIKNVKITGVLKLPKQKQTKKLNLLPSDNSLTAKVDTQGLYRYIAEFKVNYQGKTETVSFNVEPEKN
jgi:hypothetical protein